MFIKNRAVHLPISHPMPGIFSSTVGCCRVPQVLHNDRGWLLFMHHKVDVDRQKCSWTKVCQSFSCVAQWWSMLTAAPTPIDKWLVFVFVFVFVFGFVFVFLKCCTMMIQPDCCTYTHWQMTCQHECDESNAIFLLSFDKLGSNSKFAWNLDLIITANMQ